MSDKFDIGVDPDSESNGVAVYKNKQLIELVNMNTAEFTMYIAESMAVSPHFRPVIHIEDVCGTSAVFKHRFKPGEKLESKLMKAQNLGMCKQAQRAIEQVACMFNLEVVKHRLSSSWKDSKHGREALKRCTGWAGKSNADTRSAAFFGYVGCKYECKLTP